VQAPKQWGLAFLSGAEKVAHATKRHAFMAHGPFTMHKYSLLIAPVVHELGPGNQTRPLRMNQESLGSARLINKRNCSPGI
jgi:hypothetical protein